MRNIDELTVNHQQSAEKNALSASSSPSEEVEERSSDNVESQRERIDLFIDLLWVGIISNISEHYFEQAFSGADESGHAMVEFILLFLPAWSIWSELQTFLSSYYMDDLPQRLIIIWILILGLVWGNNAPYLLSDSNAIRWTISVYIIATGTLRFTELIYSIWIPWLRRRWIWRVFITLPITGFWVAAIFTRGNTQLGMVFATLVCERLWVVLEASPLGERYASFHSQPTRISFAHSRARTPENDLFARSIWYGRRRFAGVVVAESLECGLSSCGLLINRLGGNACNRTFCLSSSPVRALSK